MEVGEFHGRLTLAHLLVLAGLTAGLAGCGKKEEPVAPSTANVLSSPSRESTGAAAPAPAPGPERKTTINELDPITVAYPPSGVVLGQGYDYVTQRWLPSVCVSGKSVPLGAGEMTVKFKDLQDRQQVFESLKVSVSGGGSVGVASVSVSADYAKSVDIKTERRNVLATVDSMKGGEQMAPAEAALAVTLSKPALDKANETADVKRNPFRSACGDGYVAAIRKGARLSGVLSFAMDATDMQESLGVSASGGYGPAKAKASMERVRRDTDNKMNTELTLLQVGGNRELNPSTPQEFIGKMGKFGAYSDAEAVPLEVVILPYRVLGDIPASVRERPLPDLGVRGLSTHYWRLSDLSALYARASMNRAAYYHPFVAPDQLVSKARVLQNAALCVAEMLDICNVEATEEACSLDTLTQRARVRQVCVQSEPAATVGERIEALELAIGSRGASAVLNSDATFKSPEAARALQRWNEGAKAAVALSASAPPPPPAASASKSQPSAAAMTAWSANTYDLWFRNYARAPWPRQLNAQNTSVEGADMTVLLDAFCKARRLDCTNVDYTHLSDKAAEAPTSPRRDVVFREFVIAARLFPVAAAVCDTQLSHPMCQLPDVLSFYVSDLPGETPLIFGPDREFRPLAEKTAPPVNVPPREPRRTRGDYGCQTRPGGPGYPC